MRVQSLASLPVVLLLIAGCGPIPDTRDFTNPDLIPPIFLGAMSSSPTSVSLFFDESVRVEIDTPLIVPALAVTAVESTDQALVLSVQEQTPGRRYVLTLTALDRHGNFNAIVTAFYGYNPRLPSLRINEFTTQGSSSHPDLVELIVEDDGNVGGAVLYQGIPSDYTDRLVFPAIEVRAGDFILVHFRPEGLAEEIDESTDKTVSGGLDSSPDAYDLWVREGKGLSGNNGVLFLSRQIGGTIIDGVLYSNRTSDSDTTYDGFGKSATLTRATGLVDTGAWLTEHEFVRPEDAVNPDDSTSTRSINRIAGQDTNTRHDWYIVPTRGSTFGATNNPEVYVP